MSGEKFKGIPYTGTLPATLTGTKAGYLHKYKIYGNTEQTGTPTPENPIEPSECGERTENLFSSIWEQGSINGTTGRNEPSMSRVRTAEYIEVIPNKIYSFSRSIYSGFMNLRFYTADKSFVGVGSASTIRLIAGANEGNPMNVGNSFCCFEIIDTNIKYMRIGDQSNDLLTKYMMVEGEYTEQTMPEYEPYGYKLPLTSGNTPVDIYIGDDTLSAEEYVDSDTGKIYRMVSGVLTPTDPPVPIPAIPTTANSTTISWAGEGLAPSQFDSIQEWVDIPTYTRVNGEWVADN